MTVENTKSLDTATGDPGETERGASLVEYALLVALITIVCIIAINKLGGAISDQFMAIGKAITG